MKNQRKAILWALLAVVFWSTVASAFKIALKVLSPFQLILVASITSFLIFFILILVQGKFRLLLTVNRRGLLLSVGQGLFNPFLYYLVLFKAYDLNPAQVTQSLNMVWPIVLAVLSAPVLGHKISSRNVWGILLSFVGVVFIASQGSISGFYKTDLIGALLALASSVIWSLYWIFSVQEKRDKLVVFFWNFVFGISYLVVYGLFAPGESFQIQPDGYFFVAIYIGLFELGLTYVVWMKALQYSDNNAVTGNFIFLSPFLSLIFIHFILHEVIHLTTFFGLALIIFGIFVQQLKVKRWRIR
ncbi:DMT family transporter [uncultured Sunxiuqinia sp.]|uniref:DMT family transporter n=1 Tax=uncultured Sunxiuqinia sp. TaxID=1573825 RepID=UPI0030DD6683|tara:strand:+ start:39871 stop:40770 length:900 start_codon:yes stop_codon:yes gene_type:complete